MGGGVSKHGLVVEIGNTPTIVKTGIHVDGGVRGSNPLKSIRDKLLHRAIMV